MKAAALFTFIALMLSVALYLVTAPEDKPSVPGFEASPTIKPFKAQ